MEYTIIGGFTFLRKSDSVPMYCLNLGSKSSESRCFGVQVDKVFIPQSNVVGNVSEGKKCSVTVNLQGYVQKVEIL